MILDLRIPAILLGLLLSLQAANGQLPDTRTKAMIALANEAFGGKNQQLVLRPGTTDGAPYTEVRSDGVIVGWVFSTDETVHSVGYSGEPVDILVALGSDQHIVGTRLFKQSEPILVIGISRDQLESFIAGFKGLDIRSLRNVTAVSGHRRSDALAGATVSSSVFRDAVIRASRFVARAALGGQRDGILRDKFAPATWSDLETAGAVRHREILAGELATATGNTVDDANIVLADIYLAVATPAGIGQNLLGKRVYDAAATDGGADDNLLIIANRGLLSVLGSEWHQSGTFERLAIRQGGRTIRPTAAMHHRLDRIVAEGAPSLSEMGLFVLPASSGFDAAQAFQISVLLKRTRGDGEIEAATFDVDYTLPSTYLAPAPAPTSEARLWATIWKDRAPEIGILAFALVALMAVLLLQDALVAHRSFYRVTRIGFLAFTLLFLGVYAHAQLSVVQVIIFSHALRTNFNWELFLLDPHIFVLWSFLAVAMLFWGRGVFCGWLCPFGALQELLNEIARRLRVPQWEPPWALHERLWMLKYLAFLAIFAISLNSVEEAIKAAEFEPFKTVLALHFQRSAPFVLFALATLGLGLFVRRGYCRYLCPLGAALALPARMRMFEWLKRRPQCGRECRQCEVSCPVKAINPMGAISPNECIYCLNCQALYHDAALCLGLKARAARQQARAAMTAPQSGDGTA